jgi:hypothetical protein
MFDGFAILRHAVRAAAPVLPAAAAVLALRALQGHRSLANVVGELALFVVVAVAATLALERPLLRELAANLRGAKPAAGAIA